MQISKGTHLVLAYNRQVCHSILLLEGQQLHIKHAKHQIGQGNRDNTSNLHWFVHLDGPNK
jgi:hypothetical protein